MPLLVQFGIELQPRELLARPFSAGVMVGPLPRTDGSMSHLSRVPVAAYLFVRGWSRTDRRTSTPQKQITGTRPSGETLRQALPGSRAPPDVLRSPELTSAPARLGACAGARLLSLAADRSCRGR